MNKIFSRLQFLSLLLAGVFLVSCIIEDNSELYNSIDGGVRLSQPFGVVEGTSLTLTITPASPSHKIYYTTNGTSASSLFAQGTETHGLFLYDGNGIFLQESKNPEDYALTPNVTNYIEECNFGYISKGTTLSLIEINQKGEIVAQKQGTYIFQSEGKSHFGNVPVVCLTAPIEDWIGGDNKRGLYNTLWDTVGNASVPSELKTRAWLEYYDYSANEEFSLNTQIKLGGNATRGYAKRTINANFKKSENGEKNTPPKANIFQNRIALGTKKPIQGEVRRFRLHSGGNDVYSSHFIDAAVQRIASNGDINVATAAYRPCVLYLNGEYWGVYALREHYNEDYIEYTFGVDSDDVVYVDKCYNPIPEKSKYFFNVKTDDLETAFSLLDELHDFLGITENADGTYTFDDSKDWTNDEIYEEFCSMVDIDSLIDYFLIRGYMFDTDFVSNNFRMWRTVPNPTKSKTKKSKYSDGKWRFMIHDTDWGVDINTVTAVLGSEYTDNGKTIFDYYLGKIRRTDEWGTHWEETRPELLLSRAAQNEKFKEKLWNRAKYIAKIFESEKAIALLDEMESQIEELYEDNITRWGVFGYSEESWKSAIEGRRQFFRERSSYFLDDVKTAFGIVED